MIVEIYVKHLDIEKNPDEPYFEARTIEIPDDVNILDAIKLVKYFWMECNKKVIKNEYKIINDLKETSFWKKYDNYNNTFQYHMDFYYDKNYIDNYLLNLSKDLTEETFHMLKDGVNFDGSGSVLAVVGKFDSLEDFRNWVIVKDILE